MAACETAEPPPGTELEREDERAKRPARLDRDRTTRRTVAGGLLSTQRASLAAVVLAVRTLH
jgi:hypothetical protein